MCSILESINYFCIPSPSPLPLPLPFLNFIIIIRTVKHSSNNQPSPLDIVDGFVIASVATIVVIRTTLAITGYPRLGGDAFHIAHMLWGGLALTAALLVSLLQRQANREVLALLGGVGFGFFIDEIGKFVTTDNNYFYTGSFLLMYLSLLGIWLMSRVIVAQSQHQLFALPAVWPTRRIEQRLVMIWVILQLVGLPFLAYNLHAHNSWVALQLGCIAVYYFALMYGLIQVARQKTETAARTLRLATFIAVITVLPLLYYLNPLFALIDTVCAVLVMIGLSEVSLKQLAGRLLPR